MSMKTLGIHNSNKVSTIWAPGTSVTQASIAKHFSSGPAIRAQRLDPRARRSMYTTKENAVQADYCRYVLRLVCKKGVYSHTHVH